MALMDTNFASIETTITASTHLMEGFPNLDQYFKDSPPSVNLRPRSETHILSSASQFRSKSEGVHKKTKNSPAAQTS